MRGHSNVIFAGAFNFDDFAFEVVATLDLFGEVHYIVQQLPFQVRYVHLLLDRQLLDVQAFFLELLVFYPLILLVLYRFGY